jgi:sec-independent protein translocase protein TatA
MLGLSNPVHILFLLVLLLLVFGAKRLPEMGRSLGSGMRGFKDSLSGEVNHAMELAQPVQTVTTAQPVQAATTAQPVHSAQPATNRRPSDEHVHAVSTVGEPRP